jgi:hypothetical protein
MNTEFCFHLRHLRNLWMYHFSAEKHFLSTDYTDYGEDNGTLER